MPLLFQFETARVPHLAGSRVRCMERYTGPVGRAELPAPIKSRVPVSASQGVHGSGSQGLSLGVIGHTRGAKLVHMSQNEIQEDARFVHTFFVLVLQPCFLGIVSTPSQTQTHSNPTRRPQTTPTMSTTTSLPGRCAMSLPHACGGCATVGGCCMWWW